MRRILIVGNSGTGKTTLARQLASDLGLTHIELDALFHQQDWTPTPPPVFQDELRSAMADADARTNGWTMCGNYRVASDRLGERAADTIVWLDMPRALIMRRVIARTVRRALTREELWNGNREPLTNFYRWDPEHNIMRLGVDPVRALPTREQPRHDRRYVGSRDGLPAVLSRRGRPVPPHSTAVAVGRRWRIRLTPINQTDGGGSG